MGGEVRVAVCHPVVRLASIVSVRVARGNRVRLVAARDERHC